MPRRPRVHLDWVPLHIVQRSHNRGACFFDDQDRQAYYCGKNHGYTEGLKKFDISGIQCRWYRASGKLSRF